MKFKLFTLLACSMILTACQVISPIFVDYNGVRMDVAKWINQQQLLNMQQKRSLVQLSKAQQKLYHIEKIKDDEKFKITQENTIAMHCAHLYLTDHKIQQLQSKIFGDAEKQAILEAYNQHFPKIKIDVNTIQCE
ncbi:hypothetical protein [Acinetobacter sp. ANC 4648]|uniref:hypothetical protein n=1 Tax=Acinetobacter sp. ANC 4648 TaxID=1977875 RepID=UPI000A333AE6|nr:hypothetical protein [Acinetobacter sp. ANC 4648]OTG81795.1 hypothetical protein B9T27_10920 [Acinetobacter sp. ANC 4648]